MPRRPRTLDPIDQFIFGFCGQAFMFDSSVITDTDVECGICKEPFKPVEVKAVAEKKHDCDHVVIDERHRCWICEDGSFATFLSTKSTVHEIVPGDCIPINLHPCNHLVGDVCFAKWMRNPANEGTGACLYCQEQLTRVPRSIVERVKRYFSSSFVFALPDLVAPVFFPSHRIHAEFVRQPTYKEKTKIALLVAAFLGGWAYMIIQCLCVLYRLNHAHVNKVQISTMTFLWVFFLFAQATFADIVVFLALVIEYALDCGWTGIGSRSMKIPTLARADL